VHTGDSGQLGLEVHNRSKVWLVTIKVTKGTPQKPEQLRLMMITLGTNFDQLDKIGGGLGAEIILPDTRERIAQRDFGEGVKVRLPAWCNGDIGFEKQIQFTGERTFGAASAFGHGLNAAQRLGTPRHNQAGVAKFPFAQKNGRSAWHLQVSLKFFTRASAFQNRMLVKTTLATRNAWPVIKF
jgi:hypothetical protein